MESIHINHLAVFAGAIAAFVIGGLWYSPLLFGKPWMKVNGFTPKDLEGGNPALIFGPALVLCLIISYNLAFFLGDDQTTWSWGLTAGILAGLGWSATGLSVIALFERRPPSYMLIHAGYLTLHFAVNGLIIGAWR